MVLNTDILSFFVTFAVSLNVDIIENSFNFINIQSKMTIDQFNFAGKKAIVRVDFNVPLDENGNVTDDTRIRGALPTLKKILADGGAVIMMSHMGKPKGKVNPKLSLSQIVAKVSERLGVEVKFANDCANASEATAALKPGEALLLENLRFYPEEEGKPVGVEKGTPEYDEAKKAMKESQQAFAKTLASYADCYVMDAFGTAHRKHASTAVIDEYFDKDHKMLGYLMEKEVNAVDAVLGNIKRPFTAIMGGSKVSTKIGIIENLLTKVDNLILCGGMTYTFSKALGGQIGMSICEDDKLDVALDVIKKAKENGVNLVLGTDSICGDDFKNDCNTQVCPSNAIPEGWEGMDAGPETRKAFAAAIKGAKTILWNGPAGVFEFDNFAGGSKVSTKIGIIENLLTKVDNLILCGGMTYTFAKAQGGKIGMSICEDDKLDVALDVMKKAKENGVNLVLGTDSICGDAFKNDCNTMVCPSNDIPDGWEGMDAGPATRELFANAIKGAKTILWNGPAGVFEFDNFAGGSKAIAEAIAEATKEGAFSLIGGGDSVACINKFGLADQVSYISTGGGALLEAIEGKVLPGIAAIKGE